MTDKVRDWVLIAIAILGSVGTGGGFIFEHFENHIQQLEGQISSDHDKLADLTGKVWVLQQQMQDHEDRDREEARQNRRRGR